MKKISLKFWVVTLMILFAIMCRILPHPANFSPMAATGLFGAALFSQKKWSYIIVLVAMYLSDLIINNIVFAQYFDGFAWTYQGQIFTYLALAIITTLGIFMLKKISVSKVIFSSLTASVLFFLISNFGVWASTDMYPKTFAGLGACYVAGIPFFQNTLLGDICWTTILFGTAYLIGKYVPKLQEQNV